MKNGWSEDRNGGRYHYVNDEVHNDDGPAEIWSDGYRAYYQHNKRHRVGGPARIWPDGYGEYWHHGKIHREDGPACIKNDRPVAYYLFGEKVTKEHLAIIGLDDYPESGFTKDQVLMFSLLCIGE